MRKSPRSRLLVAAVLAQVLTACIYTDPKPTMSLHAYDYPGNYNVQAVDTNLAAQEEFQTTDSPAQVLAYYQKILPANGWPTATVQSTGISAKLINSMTFTFRLEITTNSVGQQIYHIYLSNAIN